MLICGRCKKSIKYLKENIAGEPIDPDIPWDQYLCEQCFGEIWDNLFKEHCPECRAHLCEHGRECWINPWPHIMYLCYVAPRVEKMANEQQVLISEPEKGKLIDRLLWMKSEQKSYGELEK